MSPGALLGCVLCPSQEKGRDGCACVRGLRLIRKWAVVGSSPTIGSLFCHKMWWFYAGRPLTVYLVCTGVDLARLWPNPQRSQGRTTAASYTLDSQGSTSGQDVGKDQSCAGCLGHPIKYTSGGTPPLCMLSDCGDTLGERHTAAPALPLLRRGSVYTLFLTAQHLGEIYSGGYPTPLHLDCTSYDVLSKLRGTRFSVGSTT